MLDLGFTQISVLFVISGAIVLALRTLGAALLSDMAKRIGVTMWGIRLFDFALGWAHRHAFWSGTWEVRWDVKSQYFQPTNTEQARLYRMFNRVAVRASGTKPDGTRIPYLFTGTLSRDKSILTGIWFDGLDSETGYHGAFQLRLETTTRTAQGKWVGFSYRTSAIKTGALIWTRK